MVTEYIAITGRPGGWYLQPCRRLQRGHWKYDKSIAGPFKTKALAETAKRNMRRGPRG